MDGWDVVITAGSIGFILCLVPQLVRTVQRRRADDVSIQFLVLVLASSALVLPYMMHKGEPVFALAQAVNLVVWSVVLWFRLRPARAAADQARPPA